MSQPTVEIIEDSLSPEGVRLTTFRLGYWRAIHAEVMTHRNFSRNASSSRAIPVKRMLSHVWSDPEGPQFWGSNRPGMQAGSELTGWRLWSSKALWKLLAKVAAAGSWGLMMLGNHKQTANRITEPYQRIHVVVTATSYKNFFALRCHPDAMPEIQELAEHMRAAMCGSIPKALKAGEWHLPFVTQGERHKAKNLGEQWQLPIMSAARCARASFNNFDGSSANFTKDRKTFDKLALANPAHSSPLEHQAVVDPNVFRSRNFQGDWRQFREIMEIDGYGPYLPTGDTSLEDLAVQEQ